MSQRDEDILLGVPEDGAACTAPVTDEGEMCGCPATCFRTFGDMVQAYCDEHADIIDRLSPDERGNTTEGHGLDMSYLDNATAPNTGD
jgi:hypothetical protein